LVLYLGVVKKKIYNNNERRFSDFIGLISKAAMFYQNTSSDDPLGKVFGKSWQTFLDVWFIKSIYGMKPCDRDTAVSLILYHFTERSINMIYIHSTNGSWNNCHCRNGTTRPHRSERRRCVHVHRRPYGRAVLMGQQSIFPRAVKTSMETVVAWIYRCT